MPKLKTHKGTAKRIKISGTGKLIRERAFGNHILAKKSKAEVSLHAQNTKKS